MTQLMNDRHEVIGTCTPIFFGIVRIDPNVPRRRKEIPWIIGIPPSTRGVRKANSNVADVFCGAVLHDTNKVNVCYGLNGGECFFKVSYLLGVEAKAGVGFASIITDKKRVLSIEPR